MTIRTQFAVEVIFNKRSEESEEIVVRLWRAALLVIVVLTLGIEQLCRRCRE